MRDFFRYVNVFICLICWVPMSFMDVVILVFIQSNWRMAFLWNFKYFESSYYLVLVIRAMLKNAKIVTHIFPRQRWENLFCIHSIFKYSSNLLGLGLFMNNLRYLQSRYREAPLLKIKHFKNISGAFFLRPKT